MRSTRRSEARAAVFVLFADDGLGDASTDAPVWEDAWWWANALDLSGLGLLHTMFTPPRIGGLHAAGRVANAWTVNAPPDIDRLTRAGIDYLTSDRPDVAVERRDTTPQPRP